MNDEEEAAPEIASIPLDRMTEKILLGNVEFANKMLARVISSEAANAIHEARAAWLDELVRRNEQQRHSPP